MTPLAETWECSTHPDGESIVASGVCKGETLSEALRRHPEWLGSRLQGQEGLPVLIKLIDAAKDLSVQVHPDDEYAMLHEGQKGKTEMWYVLEAEPGATLIYGFAHDISVETLQKSLKEGSLLNHLHRVSVRKNDVFLVEPGTIHAIGSGVVLAEIQECSNVTYRVYDYDRTDKDGKKRPLHLKQAMQVLDRRRKPVLKQRLRLMRYTPGSASELLCRCKYFQVERVLVTESFFCQVQSAAFQVLLVLEGELCVGELSVQKGDCVFLPADCGGAKVTGRGQLLRIFI